MWFDACADSSSAPCGLRPLKKMDLKTTLQRMTRLPSEGGHLPLLPQQGAERPTGKTSALKVGKKTY